MTGYEAGDAPNADPLNTDQNLFRVGSFGSHVGGMSIAGSMTQSHYRASSAAMWPTNDDPVALSQRADIIGSMERVSCRLMHSFPWSAVGHVRF